MLTDDALRGGYYRDRRFEQVAQSHALEGLRLSVGEAELAGRLVFFQARLHARTGCQAEEISDPAQRTRRMHPKAGCG